MIPSPNEDQHDAVETLDTINNYATIMRQTRKPAVAWDQAPQCRKKRKKLVGAKTAERHRVWSQQ